MEFNKYIVVALAHIIILVPVIFYIGLKAVNDIPFNTGESQLIIITGLFTALYHANNIWILDAKLSIGALLVSIVICAAIWKWMPSPVNDPKLS